MFQLTTHQKNFIRSSVPEAHFEKMIAILQKIVPDEIYFEDFHDLNHWIKESLPIVKWDETSSSGTLVISLLCLTNPHVSIDVLFPEFLKQKVIPGKTASILSFNHMYFHHTHFPEKSIFIGEVHLSLGSLQDSLLGFDNLPLVVQELKMLLNTSVKATLFSLSKDLAFSSLQSTSLKSQLLKLIQKFPYVIDATIFDEMNRLLALSSSEFLSHRNIDHLRRLVSSFYVFRKRVFKSMTQEGEQNHFEVRFIPTMLSFPFCVKPVLGCVIVFGPLKEHEILEEKHILYAVQKIFPAVHFVKGSWYSYEYKEERIKSYYVELEKHDHLPFTSAERKKLLEGIKEQLKYCIEKLVPALFMVRNEEEVFKNTLTLRKEITSVQDLPQVMITLDHQTSTDIVFTVLWVRVRREGMAPLQTLLKPSFLRFEKSQVIGFLRKKHPIEGYVFQIKIPREPSLLRSDLSLNFYLAREKATSILTEAFGEFRDYNGGIISKQLEMLSRLKQACACVWGIDGGLIDDFFYSLSPIEKQVTLSYAHLKLLLDLFLKAIRYELKDRFDYFMETFEQGASTFLVLKFNERLLKEPLDSIADTLSPYLVKSELVIGGVFVRAYIYENNNLKSENSFYGLVSNAIKQTIQELKKTKTLRVTIPYSFTSLDPRLAGDEFTGNILRLLFEGLTRLNREGRFELGMAESISISPDKRQYTFKIREAKWSNGTAVVAHDFEYAWKKMLSSNFKTSYAYFFYPIKNAKKAKEGQVSIDEVGVKAINERTLHVELEFPTPYFLELTAHTIYSPIHCQTDISQPNWPLQDNGSYVCNGGFVLKTHHHHYYELKKNKNYWDNDQIELDSILLQQAAHHFADQMFRKGEIDWIGPPFGPWDPIFGKQEQGRLVHMSPMGVYWFIFNTQRFPFHSCKLRQAFAAAINRRKIIRSFSAFTSPAHSPLIPSKNLIFESVLEENLKHAQKLFEQVLQELGLTRETFPVITIPYAQGGIRDIAAQEIKRQWESAFKIQCELIPLDWRVAMEKMQQGKFHIGGMLWRPLIEDPIYVLSTFRHSPDQMNLSGWESSEYKAILELADWELNPDQRRLYLQQAHEILISEAPVLPVYHLNFVAMVKSTVLPPSNAPFGVLDLKWTQIIDV